MRLDLVIAFWAHHGVLGETAEALCFVFFLLENEFAGIAPALLVVRVAAVLDETKRDSAVFHEMSTNGCGRVGVPMAGAVDLFHVMSPIDL